MGLANGGNAGLAAAVEIGNARRIHPRMRVSDRRRLGDDLHGVGVDDRKCRTAIEIRLHHHDPVDTIQGGDARRQVLEHRACARSHGTDPPVAPRNDDTPGFDGIAENAVPVPIRRLGRATPGRSRLAGCNPSIGKATRWYWRMDGARAGDQRSSLCGDPVPVRADRNMRFRANDLDRSDTAGCGHQFGAPFRSGRSKRISQQTSDTRTSIIPPNNHPRAGIVTPARQTLLRGRRKPRSIWRSPGAKDAVDA